MEVARKKAVADAEFYSRQRQAAANQMLLTPEFLELRRIEAVGTNNKVYFGSSIPSMFIEAAGARPAEAVAAQAAAARGTASEEQEGAAKAVHQAPRSATAPGDASATPTTVAVGGTSDKR